ncbi:hypothetical protein [Streptomyces sp. NBC_01750]|uniref:hypothetical protein n=1 Tax=Streptomyces sp. NBC_01750 TaxID=2975928 RepID=UPI002DD8BE59|nr:hypothetical protein [Streptomyces sp. NBC_01750]WSD37495.1 hypothetical protein OG966_39780 [Streptomyces sp. NBC_01750]
MEHNEAAQDVPAGFTADEYARIVEAARLVGKDPHAFMRDAALEATEDPFLKALKHAGDTVARLTSTFGTAEVGAPAADTTRWPDAPPMSSRDLEHGRAA